MVVRLTDGIGRRVGGEGYCYGANPGPWLCVSLGCAELGELGAQ